MTSHDWMNIATSFAGIILTSADVYCKMPLTDGKLKYENWRNQWLIGKRVKSNSHFEKWIEEGMLNKDFLHFYQI